MLWKCKYCQFSTEKRAQLLRHFRLKHGGYTRTVPFPCLHDKCMCTFKSVNALRTHLSRVHSNSRDNQTESSKLSFSCQLCEFTEPCTMADFFSHLRSIHLRVNQRVQCPFSDCSFQTTVYSTFNAHQSKQHRTHTWRMFKSEIISEISQDHAYDLAQEGMSDVDTLELEDTEESTVTDLRDLTRFQESFTVQRFCRFCMATRSEAQNREMATNSRMLMRVIVSEADIRKVILPAKPASVEELICQLQETLVFDFNFTLQFEDPDFNNSLCNLTDISELPEKPTLKVIPTLQILPIGAPIEQLSDSLSNADTEILSNSSSLQRIGQWPDEFDVPLFSVDVEYRLRQGNLSHLKDGTLLKVTKELKHEILERIAERMYTFKAYPDDAEYDEVAAALVKKHPCLTERGSRNGWSGWKNSLKFKMGNYRTKRRKSGSHDVAVNGGKRGMNLPDGEPSRKNIKKAKKCEINFLPDFPDGRDQTSLEAARIVLVEEMRKRTPSVMTVKHNMDLSFALRRKEVVEKKPAICQLVERWPALFQENQVYMEFTRIAGIDLKQNFYAGLDQHNCRLLEVFRTKRGLTGHILSRFLQQANVHISEPTVLRTLALRGLPVILGDNTEDFFKTCFDADDEQMFSSIATGILIVERDEGGHHPHSLCLNPLSVGIILEGKVVMDNLHDLPQAMCLLFGLTYALHLDYPKCMSYTFEFIQRVILGLGHNKLKPKLQSLLNQLLL
ncbi:uncharacterized protein [Hoplias malabaricus]|uniref:uncharacterized protein isoform X2 n=1 Tax=Hoplias malabaricus TaxID=27720 RepID=UPI0034637004